ncbi:MAG TPA: hypothetical protein VJ872_08365 [Nocardioides sp.]|nr:hypothetical protein [Nocardioides sp.]
MADEAEDRGQKTLIGLALGVPGALIRAATRVPSREVAVVEAPAEAPREERVRRPREGGASTVLDALLQRALLQTSRDAEDTLATAILLQLVPDEARMLTALARSGWTPAVDVTPRGGRAEGTLVGASLLGRQAGVALLEHTPAYLSRLRGHGLVRATDEREGHEQEYEILLAEPAVLRAVKAGKHAGRGPVVRRYGVELSPLGRLVLRVGGSEALAE